MKLLVPTAIGLAIGAFFVANVPLTPHMALVSSIAVVGFAVPSYIATIRKLGRRGFATLAALGLYALTIESLAIATGVPYGHFTYTGLLAHKVFDLTPWTVAFAYPPIILFAYVVARRAAWRASSWWQIIVTSALVATMCDVVLDPAAVRLHFWYWDQPGFFYGVPLVNFLGWLLTSSIAAAILHALWGKRAAPTNAIGYSGLAILWFWTAINAWFGHIIPVIFGFLLLGYWTYARPHVPLSARTIPNEKL